METFALGCGAVKYQCYVRDLVGIGGVVCLSVSERSGMLTVNT